MTVLITCIAIAVFFSGIIWVGLWTDKQIKANPPAKAIAAKPALTWAAKQIITEYRTIPQRYRPDGNIEAMVRALDTKHGDLGNTMFRERDRYSYSSQWDYGWLIGPRTDATRPARRDYTELHDLMNNIKSSIKEREEALKKKAHDDKVAGLAGDFADIEDFKERARNEIKIIQAGTDEVA